MDIIIILVVGFALRFTISFTHSYSNDELSAINRLQFDNFSELIEKGVKTGDMHPAGVQVFMKFWSQIAGVNEIGMRFPFVLCGTISILLIFLIGKKWVNRQAGIIAAIFLSLLYFPIMNSEFARPYSPGLMFCLLAAWYYLKILFDEKHEWKDAILLALSVAAAMYTHHFAFMFLGWLGFSGIIFWKKSNAKYLLSAAGITILLYLPHIAITRYQTSVGGLGWLGPPDNDWLFQFVFHLFNESWWVIGGVGILIVAALILKEKTELINSRVMLLFLVWFFGIYIVAHIYSISSTPILKFPVMLFAVPFLILPLSYVLSKFKYQLVLYSFLMLLLATSTTRERELFGNMHYELFEEVAEDIVRWNDDYGADNIYTVYNLNNPNYMNFYAEQWDKKIDFDWDVIEFWDAPELREDLKNSTEEYCVVGYSARLTKPEIFETCKEFYPNILEYKKYNNAAVFLLSRNRPAQLTQQKAVLSKCTANNRNGWNFNQEQLGDWSVPIDTMYEDGLMLTEYERKRSFKLGEGEIYGPEFRFKLNQIEEPFGKYIKVNVKGDVNRFAEFHGESTIYVSADRNGEQLMHRDEPFWQGYDIDQMLFDSGEGYFTFKVHEFFEPEDEIRIGVYNRNTSNTWIYSIEIEVYDNIWN